MLLTQSRKPVANPPGLLDGNIAEETAALATVNSLDERSDARRATISSAIPNNCVFRGPGAVVTFPNILASFLTLPSGLNDRARERA